MELLIYNVQYKDLVGDIRMTDSSIVLTNITGQHKDTQITVPDDWMIENFLTEYSYFARKK